MLIFWLEIIVLRLSGFLLIKSAADADKRARRGRGQSRSPNMIFYMLRLTLLIPISVM